MPLILTTNNPLEKKEKKNIQECFWSDMRLEKGERERLRRRRKKKSSTNRFYYSIIVIEEEEEEEAREKNTKSQYDQTIREWVERSERERGCVWGGKASCLLQLLVGGDDAYKNTQHNKCFGYSPRARAHNSRYI